MRKTLLNDWLTSHAVEPASGKVRYLFSVGLAAVLLLAGCAVYGRAWWVLREGEARLGLAGLLPLLAMSYGSLVLLAVAILESRVRHARQGDLLLRQRTLSQLVDHLTNTQEEERRDISGLLHDKIGALLTAAKLEAEALGRRAGSDGEQPRRLEGLLDGALEEVRGLASVLYPRAMLHAGLRAALEEVVGRLRAIEGVPAIEMTLTGDADALPSPCALCVTRLIQECLMNVVRHARAGRVLVSVRIDDRQVEGGVADDGVGMQGAKPGMGLMLMEERVGLLGGTLVCGESEWGGTRVTFRIPWAAGVADARQGGPDA